MIVILKKEATPVQVKVVVDMVKALGYIYTQPRQKGVVRVYIFDYGVASPERQQFENLDMVEMVNDIKVGLPRAPVPFQSVMA